MARFNQGTCAAATAGGAGQSDGVAFRLGTGVLVKKFEADRVLRGVVPLALIMGMMAAPAQAQSLAPAQAQSLAPGAEAPAAETAADSGDIVITGTRIRQPNLDSFEPTVSLGRSYLEDRGITNLADALRESPGVRGSTTPNGLQAPFGQGMNFTNLYGLGVNRTLTLINGRRSVSSSAPALTNATPGTPVDLNIIPTILIDRVDRVSVGGAPVYGTDAIAGTINVILRRRMHGLDVSATSGISSEGDNARYNLSAAGGADFAGGRGNFTAAVSYDHSDGVLSNARSVYRASVFNVTNPTSALAATLGPAGRTAATDGRVNPEIGFNNTAADGFPGTIIASNVSIPGLSANGVLASGAGAFNWQFNPAGNLVSFNRGTLFNATLTGPGANPAQTRASGGDGLQLNNFNQIVSGLKRFNTAAFFSFDLTDRVTFFAEGQWSRSTADQLVSQPSYNGVIAGGRSGSLTFSVNNPFLTPAARQRLTTLGYTTTFTISRANTDLSDPSGSTDSDVYRGVVGLEGKFAVSGRDYNFEVYADYGRADVTDYYQDIDQQKFINAINVTTSGGQIVCSATQNVSVVAQVPTTLITPVADSACAPLNLFGSGAASPAALAYIRRNTVTSSRMQQFVANANVGGSPFDLFGNPVSFNLGYEHHSESARFVPDSFIQGGLGRLAAVAPVSGRYNLDEEFGEVLVPFIRPENNAIISHLEVFGRLRNVDSSTGTNFRSWSAGGVVGLVRDVEFRGNFTRSFRAPSVTELFTPRTVGAISVPELCSVGNINAGPVPTVRAANCAAFNARYGQPAAPSVPLVPAYFGGNPNLRNETADSFTYGVILRPRFVPGLSVSVDYVNIKVKDPIITRNVAEIASGCFDNVSFNVADPINGNGFCSLIQRNAAGQIVIDSSNPGVTTGYVNGKQIRLDAVQASVDFVTGLGQLGIGGNLAISAELFFLRNRLTDITGISPTQSEGMVGDPKFQGQLRLRYDNAAWGSNVNLNVTGAQAVAYTNRGANPNDIREFDHFDRYATVDAGLWIKAAESFRLTLSVTNLFNRTGQEYYGTIIPASINDALGRRFAVSARKSF